jgi:hypothetical protein
MNVEPQHALPVPPGHVDSFVVPERLPFEDFRIHGPALLDEVGGLALTVAAVSSGFRLLRAVPG